MGSGEGGTGVQRKKLLMTSERNAAVSAASDYTE